MHEATERDALEFGRHVRAGGWLLGLLVARNVEKAEAGRPSKIGKALPISGKVSGNAFAEKAGPGITRPTVLRHLEAWEAAAAAGHVPAADTLSPGVEVELDVDSLPDWSEFYPPATGFAGKERTYQRHAELFMKTATPKQVAEILTDPHVRRNVAAAQQIAWASEPMRYSARTDPTFIALVVRISSALIELESVVKSWENPSAIPEEFSAASFDDIAEKAMRIKDTVNALRSADNDKFQDIVRNFRVISSGA